MSVRHRVARVVRRSPAMMRVLYYLYRFIQPKYSVGVIGVVINDAGEVLLVEHVFHPYRPWGLPGGWIDFNEDPSDAVQRELREELELDIVATDVLLTQRTQFNHLDVAFLCHVDDYHIGTLSYELLSYRWFTPDDLPPLHDFHREAIARAHIRQH